MSTEQNLKMSTTKIFDIKGAALLKAMASERMSLTCAQEAKIMLVWRYRADAG